MMYFHTNESVNRKMIISLVTFLFFGIGIGIFFMNRDSFGNHKTYSIRSYSYTIPYKIKQMLSLSEPSVVFGVTATTSPYSESIPVLVYHGVLGDNKNSSDGEATNIDLDTFWDQMKELKENGWSTVTMEDFYDFKLGIKKLPAKSFMITFDDGRKDSYYPADPILKAFDFHAVMFVIDRYSLGGKSSYYLSESELGLMAKSKEWEIQSHGYSSHSEYPIDDKGNTAHFFSNKLWLSDFKRIETTNEYVVRVTKDLQESKDSLEKSFQKPIIAFAFPFGDYGGGEINFQNSEYILVPEVLNIYPLAFFQYSSVFRYSQNYPEPDDADGNFMIRRIGISPDWTGKDLLRVFESGGAKKLPFNAKFDKSDGWIDTTWGKMHLSNNILNIGSSPNSTGSTIILDGTKTWTDYTITATIRWIKGSNVYLQARYKDDDNLTACNFNKNLVHVEQTHNGESRVIAGIENEFDPGQDLFTISMKVSDRLVECSIDGNVIVSTPFLEESLSSGGVGIKTWDSIAGNSEIIIENLSVEI